MHSRFASAICLAMMGLGGQQGGVDAQESEDVRLIGYEHLALLGDAIQTRRSLRDNVDQFEQRGKEIRQHAQQLPGAQLFFTVAVKRVLKDEVILFVPDARETRVLLKHNKPPEYGNLHTVEYSGSLATRFAQILSKPISLRIGSEISLEIAKQLRKGDLLVLRGKLATVHVLLDVFAPHAVAVISDVAVVQVNPQDASKEFFYK